MLPLIVVAAVIEQGGRYLVTQRPAGGRHPLMWEFPGGKLEPDEDPRDCIVREVAEELGVVVAPREVVDVVYHRYDFPVLILAYRCTLVSGSPKNIQVADHRWVTAGELPGLDFLPADLPIIARISGGAT